MFKRTRNKLLLIFLFSLFIFNRHNLADADDFSLQLKQGHNFISLPLNLADPFIQQAFYSIEGRYTNVWRYDNTDPENIWKHYHPDYIGLSDLNNINLGQGYWVQATQDSILTVSGLPFTTGLSLNLTEGWNAVGWPYLESQTIPSALYSLTFGVDYSHILQFNSQHQSFEEFLNDPGLNQFDTFEPGRAYYIYALRDSTATLLPLPQITITAPAQGTLFNTPQITVSGTVNYAGITVEVNDIPATVIDTTFSAEITLAEGTNTIEARATNQGGNTASFAISVTLDTTPPPAPGLNLVTSPTNQTTQTLSGTKEANTSIWINGGQSLPLNSATIWEAVVSLSEGENIFNITAKDAALNESQPAVANIFLDTSSPTTPVVTDDGVYTTSTTQLHASWTSEDPQTGIVEYQYAIGTTIGGTDIVGWTSTGTQTEITHSGLTLTQGQRYYISVKAQNGAGSWSQVGNSNGIFVNQTTPTIIELQPPDGSGGYAEDNINFSVNAEDEDGDSLLYQFSLDGEITQPWQGSPEFNWSTTGVSLGIHSMQVEVSDSHGGEVAQDIGICLFRRPPGPPSSP